MKRALLLAMWLTVASPAVGQTVSLQSKNGKFTADVVLNERLTVRALVDLGATTTVICERMARSLSLPRGEHAVLRTVGKHLPAKQTRLSSLRLETIVLEDVDALILGDRWCDEVLLGVSALRRLRLIMEDDTLILGLGKAESMGSIRK